MRIGIDARKAADYGIGTYIRSLLGQLVRRERGAEWVLFHRPGDEGLLPAHERVRLVPEPAANYSLRELRTLAGLARREGCDLYHAPHYVLPFGLGCPAVVTVHDLIHLVAPEYRGLRRLYARFMVGHAVRDAARVITVSHCSERDLLRLFPRAAGKVRVIGNGVEERYHPRDAAECAAWAARTHGLQGRYLLFVGNPKAHKNVELLLAGFARLIRLYPDLHLALVGGADPQRRALARRAGELEILPRTHLIPPVGGEDLARLYSGAAAFVFPSRYEGFGLPPLEAMACGAPVAASSSASLPEVLGPAALYFSPESAESLVREVCRILDDPRLRERLRAFGLERARHFTWEEAARRTFEVYLELSGRAL